MIKLLMEGKARSDRGIARRVRERNSRRRDADRDADEDRHAPGFARKISRENRARGGRNRAAAYELALASGRNYKPGDQISYYIKATPKKVAAYEAAKLASDFDPQNRDENVDYYVAKLDELVKKFAGISGSDETPPSRRVSEALVQAFARELCSATAHRTASVAPVRG